MRRERRGVQEKDGRKEGKARCIVLYCFVLYWMLHTHHGCVVEGRAQRSHGSSVSCDHTHTCIASIALHRIEDEDTTWQIDQIRPGQSGVR